MAWPNDNTTLDTGALVHPLRYTHPDTSSTVTVTSGPWLDPSRATPYGAQATGSGSDCWKAVQWALDNCRRPDPADRRDPEDPTQTMAGGPPGCFNVIMPSAGITSGGINAFWHSSKTLLIRPNGHGLVFCGTGDGQDVVNTGINNATRFFFGDDATTPFGILVQASKVHIHDMTLAATAAGIATRNPIGLAITNVTSISDSGYDPHGTGISNINSIPPRDLTVERVSIGGFDVAIANGLTLSDTACDYTILRKIHGRDNGRGIDMRATFCQQIVMDDIRLGADSYVINITGGFTGKIVDLNPSGPGPIIFFGDDVSKFNSYLEINNTKFDNNFQAGAIFLEANIPGEGSYTPIVVNGGVESNARESLGEGINQAMFDLTGTVFLRINNFKYPPGFTPAANALGAKPVIIYDGISMQDTAVDGLPDTIAANENHNGFRLCNCNTVSRGIFDWDAQRGEQRLNDTPQTCRDGNSWFHRNPAGDALFTSNVGGDLRSDTIKEFSGMPSV